MNSFALFRKRKEKKRIHLLFLAAGSPEMEKTMKPFNLNVKKCFYMFVDHDHHVLLVVKNSMTSTLADGHCWDSFRN
jgi:hypothetical protein